jgi:hypothetical protein
MTFLGVKDVDELIKQDPKVVEQHIIDYMISLDGLGLSRATKSFKNGRSGCPLFDKRHNS